MESMRRSEENISRHPNKVAPNTSIVTGSNIKHSKLVGNTGTTGPVSSNVNKKLNTKSQLQQTPSSNIVQNSSCRNIATNSRLTTASKNSSQTDKNLSLNIGVSSLKPKAHILETTKAASSISFSSISSITNECKDTNFEYEDEWDIGGIPELLDDLDADIEKSSSVTQLSSALSNSGGGNNTLVNKTQSSTILISSINAETDPLSASSGKTSTLKKQSEKPLRTPTEQISKHRCTSLNKSGSNIAINSTLLGSREGNHKTVTSSSTSSNIVGSKNLSLKNFKQKESILVARLSADQNSFKLTGIDPALSSSNSLGGGPNSNKLSSSNFTGFAKGGNLVSLHGNTSTDSILSNRSVVGSSQTLPKFQTSSVMSSQSSGGSSSNNSSSVGGTGSNQGSSQNSSNSTSSSKSNAKMSIDHQATLDKGLKMKIKRTKPGTKTSEAKHEIVKATEQQQNGTLGSSNSLDDSGGPSSSSHSSTSSSINNSSSSNSNTSNSGGSNTNVSNAGSSNKKHLGSSSNNGNNNGNQCSSHSGGNSNSSGPGNGNNAANNSQTTPQSTKRGSSGHRRDKAKEKAIHSNRLTSEKSSTGNEKESSGPTDKSSGCQCIGDSSANGNGSCSNHACPRRSDNSNNTTNMLTQRMNTSAVGPNTPSSAIPPGVFTPSIGSPAPVSSGATGSLIVATSSATSTPSVQSTAGTSGPNAPGPPGKDASTCGNIKISSHIAAQLAAAAASNTFTGSISGGNNDGKPGSNVSSNAAKQIAPGMISATVHHTISVPANHSNVSVGTGAPNSSLTCPLGSSGIAVVDDGIKSPPAKRSKHNDHVSPSKDMVDICIGTSVGTITEPDCLGPCEPGTSVTLEGIVWHETEGGVLVVNVTWRGKTYVGTLLDCTRHDWAPPRFCDSPTEELDARTPKGRGKRGRSAALTPDLSNFTETRSSVHSKLRNGATKGRGTSRTTVGGTNSTTTTNMSSGSSSGNGGGATPSTSPTAFLPPRSEKRKSKDESPSPINGDTDCTGNIANASGIPIANTSGNLSSQPQSLVNPMTGLNVQISTKKCKTASPCAISPVLLECPEQDCSKKYKHANGLRYHQSAAHGSIGSMDEDSLQLPDEPPTTPSPGPATQAIAISIPAAGETESVPDNATPLGSPIAPIVNAGSNSTPSISAASPSGSSLPPPQLSQQTSLINVTNADTVPTAASMTVGPVASSIISVPDTATATNSMSGVLLSATQPTQLPPPLLTSSQQHSVAGGSITAGVSGQALSQQALGISTTTNMSQHLTEQQQNILQQGSLKSGVLRFGQPNDTPATATSSSILNLQQQTVAQGASGGPQTNTLPGQNTLRTPTQLAPTSEAQQQSSVSSYSSGAITTAPSLQQGISLSTKPSAGGFPVVAKQKKCRKSPGPIEYDGMMSRDDVQSPAYSDISDDSTPVGDQEILDKSQPQKHLELLNKKPIDLGTSSIGGGAQAIPALGGYGMYQFYQQQQYMVPPDQTQSQTPTKGLLPPNLGQQTLTLPSQTQQQGPPPQHHIQQQSPHLTDYTNKTKDPPLDLITKSSNQHQSIGQQHPIQDNVGNQKENPASQPPPPPVNLSNVAPPGLGGLTNLAPAAGPSGLPTPSPAKPMSHFYPFNYMASGYPYNVEPNYGPVSIVSAEDSVKLSAHGGISSSQSQSATQHQGSVAIKEERTKESPSPHDGSKLTTQQMVAAKVIKTEPLTKQEIKQEPNTNAPSQPQQHSTPQQPHAIHPKDLQGLGGYPNIYQRHPMSLAAQQHLSREEELRRYYILSEEQRRAAIRAVQAQNSSGGGPPGSLQSQISVQHKDDSNSVSQHPQHSMAQQQQQNMQQQQQKSKSQSSVSNLNAGNNKAANLSKETPKSKQDEEIKVKQEGQKPTMETQGPPPPPTSQYFLHPSYIAPAPFSFDPNHPMYRNVLMSAAGPYNAPPYHLPMPRYHAPEDLSRNAGTKALDALHHAASQYYTTHKIHELSERALKSPTSSGSGPGGPVKVSVSSPNVGVQQQPTNAGNVVVSGSAPGSGNSGPNSGSHIPTNQSGSGTGLTLNLQPPPNTMSGPSSKTDLMPQKTLGGSGNSSGMIGPPMNIDPLKQQGANGSSGTVSASGNVAGNTGSSGSCAGTATDSRSPPPQRHVHTHHHTHVGLGYPMYTAPYGAAVLASQQAAAVAVINPFPPGPTK